MGSKYDKYSTNPFYKTAKWERLRNTALRRDAYMCQACKDWGRMVQADCVHHIFPRDAYPAYRHELWNLMSLCNKCHNEMHNKYSGGLSKRGMIYMRALASRRGIKVDVKDQTILVVGLPGSGKSTYCKAQINEHTLVYDLDAIAGAFRLSEPHEEYFRPARKMANDFLKGFLLKAHDYCRTVYVIRTAPSIKEFQDIDPDRVVFCTEQYVFRNMYDRKEAEDKLVRLMEYCEEYNIPHEKLGEEDGQGTPPQLRNNGKN